MSERRRAAESNEVEARSIDFSDVPLGGHLPEGSYDMKIASIEQRYSQEKGVLMYTIEFRVQLPEAMFGRGLFETLVFGTTPFDPGESKNPDFIAYSAINDPEAEDPMTLKMSRGVQMFKQILHYTGLDMDREIFMPELLAQGNSGELLVGMRLRVEEQQTGRYAGSIRNRIGHVYEIGREEPGFTPNPAKAKRRGARETEGGAGGRRRATQPDNMARSMNSTKARELIKDDLAEAPLLRPLPEDDAYDDIVDAPAPASVAPNNDTD